MRTAGISGYVKRRKFRTTFSIRGVRVAGDLVERDFNPPAPDRLWASDIKYVSTWEDPLPGLRDRLLRNLRPGLPITSGRRDQ